MHVRVRVKDHRVGEGRREGSKILECKDEGGGRAARPAPLWSAVNSSRPGSESPAPASLVTPTCAAAHAQHIRLNPPHSELLFR